jgi:uncharacterized membrane protein
MGENQFSRWPVVVYGADLLACAIAYWLLQNRLLRLHGPDSTLARAVVGHDAKGRASPVLYLAGIALALAGLPWAGMAVFTLVAVLWLIPDRRIESEFRSQGSEVRRKSEP